MDVARQQYDLSTETSIPIDALLEHPANFFRSLSEEEIGELARSIKDVGLTHRVVVTPSDSGDNYLIVSGHQRVRALRRLGWTVVPCSVRVFETPEQAEEMLIDANYQTRALSPMENSRAVRRKLELLGRRQGARSDLSLVHNEPKIDAYREAAQELGVTRSKVVRADKLNDLVPEMQALVDDGRIKPTAAYEIAFMSQDGQRAIVETLTADHNMHITVEHAKSMREAEDSSTDPIHGDDLTDDERNRLHSSVIREMGKGSITIPMAREILAAEPIFNRLHGSRYFAVVQFGYRSAFSWLQSCLAFSMTYKKGKYQTVEDVRDFFRYRRYEAIGTVLDVVFHGNGSTKRTETGPDGETMRVEMLCEDVDVTRLTDDDFDFFIEYIDALFRKYGSYDDDFRPWQVQNLYNDIRVSALHSGSPFPRYQLDTSDWSDEELYELADDLTPFYEDEPQNEWSGQREKDIELFTQRLRETNDLPSVIDEVGRIMATRNVKMDGDA